MDSAISKGTRTLYEVGLVTYYDEPATEKRGPYSTRKLAIEACNTFNQEIYPGRKSLLHKWPRWMWAELGEIPLKSQDTSPQK